MNEHQLQSPFTSLELLPLHHHPRSPLKAWNAADELILHQVAETTLPPSPRVLIINDSAGALALSLHHFSPDSWNDARSSELALRHNQQRNHLPERDIRLINDDRPLNGPYDLALIQLPKTLSLLEYQLLALRSHITTDTSVIAGGMVKHMTPAQTALFETVLGPSHTSLAQKKARLILSRLDPKLTPTALTPACYTIPDSPLQLINHANVFSRERLDIGTRFLLQHFPDLTGARSILDLGCGNGALGIVAAWQHPQATLHFVDDSALALQSARESFAINNLANPVQFHHDDSLTHFEGKVDAVLCNPPFHEGNRVHTDIARRMFRDAARHLNPNGSLYIVANRHLEYRPLLQRHFSHVQQLATNPKFVVVKAAM